MLAKPDFLPEDTRFAEFEWFFASSRRRDVQDLEMAKHRFHSVAGKTLHAWRTAIMQTVGMRRAWGYFTRAHCAGVLRQWTSYVIAIQNKRDTRADLYRAKTAAITKRHRLIQEEAAAEAKFELKSVREGRSIRKAKLGRGLRRAGAEVAFEQQLAAAARPEPEPATESALTEEAILAYMPPMLTTWEAPAAQPENVADDVEVGSADAGQAAATTPEVAEAVASLLVAVEEALEAAEEEEAGALLVALGAELEQLQVLLFEMEGAVCTGLLVLARTIRCPMCLKRS